MNECLEWHSKIFAYSTSWRCITIRHVITDTVLSDYLLLSIIDLPHGCNWFVNTTLAMSLWHPHD